ncbi:hypothetical protein ACLMJK_005729 [Lecanora helva]
MKLPVEPHANRVLFIIIIFTSIVQISISQNTGNPADDFATSGSYHIVYCNANSTTNNQAAYLQTLLPTAWNYLHELFQDIPQGVTSRHGYAAFFKTHQNLEAVRQVYQDILDGPDVPTSAGPGTPVRLTPPTIVCVNAGEPDTYRFHEYCSRPAIRGSMVAGVPAHTGIVFLCPQFFRLPRIPRPGSCPRMDYAINQFAVADNGLELGRNQFAILVHEIAHVYLQERGFGGELETYGIQEAVALNASASYTNAMNYAFYAAAIQADCTEFPSPPIGPGQQMPPLSGPMY